MYNKREKQWGEICVDRYSENKCLTTLETNRFSNVVCYKKSFTKQIIELISWLKILKSDVKVVTS